MYLCFLGGYRGCWASQVVLVVKNPSANAGDIRDMVSIPGSGRSPGGGHDNTLQYSCLESPRDRGAWWATVARSWTQLKQLRTHARTTHRWPCWHLARHLWSIYGAKSKFLGPQKSSHGHHSPGLLGTARDIAVKSGHCTTQGCSEKCSLWWRRQAGDSVEEKDLH